MSSPYVCNHTARFNLLTSFWIVRYIPDWFPGARFKTLAKEVRDKYKISMGGPMEYVKSVMKVRPEHSQKSGCIWCLNVTISLAKVLHHR